MLQLTLKYAISDAYVATKADVSLESSGLEWPLFVASSFTPATSTSCAFTCIFDDSVNACGFYVFKDDTCHMGNFDVTPSAAGNVDDVETAVFVIGGKFWEFSYLVSNNK